MNRLEDIGFYTLEDSRAKNCSSTSPLWRCELLLTSRCNFRCPYCRGPKPGNEGDLSFEEASRIVNMWCVQGLRNIRFSGGEPALWPRLLDLVQLAKARGVKRVALSTNGSASLGFYRELAKAGVDDFSISFDACCASTANRMAGGESKYNDIRANAQALSTIAYTTAGVVLTEGNIVEVGQIVAEANRIGFHDVRLISAAQWENRLTEIFVDGAILAKMPILRYRIQNVKLGLPMRGMGKSDCAKCHLVIDDMAIAGKHHFPCIIYLREHGNPIGEVGPNMRDDRLKWLETHDSYADQICQKNCLDVCVQYNNRVRDLKASL